VNRVFIDTSAILALLVGSDKTHGQARKAFDILSARQAMLTTTSYILVETYALLGRRVGSSAVRSFRNEFAGLLDVIWIDSELHERALDLLIQRASRALSLVDAASFVVMRQKRIDEAFPYDRHFSAEGFTLI